MDGATATAGAAIALRTKAEGATTADLAACPIAPAETKGAAADSSAATLRVLVAAGRDPAQTDRRLAPMIPMAIRVATAVHPATADIAMTVVADLMAAAMKTAAADGINL